MTTTASTRMCLTLGTLLAFAAGCEVGVESYGSSAGETWESFRARTYREPWAGGHFIVDGDVPIKDEKQLHEFWSRLEQGALSVNTGGDDRWSDAEKHALTYCVSSDFGPRKAALIEALAAATDDGWEAMADVNFIHVPSEDRNCTAGNRNVVFNIRPVSGQDYLARAFFPSYTRDSREVLVDDTAFSVADWPLAHILGHELGHVLGFRHEHTRAEAGMCFEDTSYRPLTPYDAASIMHYPQCNGSSKDLDWTEQDAIGAASLYGEPGAPPPGQNGTPRSEQLAGNLLEGDAWAWFDYAVLPGTTFSIVMTGTGDPDLYVRFDGEPSELEYDCRPFADGADERCTLTVPQGASVANFMVIGFTPSTFSLAVNWTAP